MSEKYNHPGWEGEPYKSDFNAKWGRVVFGDIFTADEALSVTEAANQARHLGYRYVIAGSASKYGGRLYKVTFAQAKCVYAILAYMESNAAASKNRYHSVLDERLKQIVRSAKNRARIKGLAFTIDQEDIIRRMQTSCEATGIEFNLEEVDSAFGPSIDQIVPGGGYTPENVQVVCVIYNMMKNNFSSKEVEFFLERASGRH